MRLAILYIINNKILFGRNKYMQSNTTKLEIYY